MELEISKVLSFPLKQKGLDKSGPFCLSINDLVQIHHNTL